MTTEGGDLVVVNTLPSNSPDGQATFDDTSASQSQPLPAHIVTDYPNGIYMCSASDSSISHSESEDDDDDVYSGSEIEKHEGSHDGEEKHVDESIQNSTCNDDRRLSPFKQKPETEAETEKEKVNVVAVDDGRNTGIVTSSSEQGKNLLQLNVFTGVGNLEQSKDIDILEVASLVGIRFEPPSWWPPGGYNVVKMDRLVPYLDSLWLI